MAVVGVGREGDDYGVLESGGWRWYDIETWDGENELRMTLLLLGGRRVAGIWNLQASAMHRPCNFFQKSGNMFDGLSAINRSYIAILITVKIKHQNSNLVSIYPEIDNVSGFTYWVKPWSNTVNLDKNYGMFTI